MTQPLGRESKLDPPSNVAHKSGLTLLLAFCLEPSGESVGIASS